MKKKKSKQKNKIIFQEDNIIAWMMPWYKKNRKDFKNLNPNIIIY